MKTHPLRGDVHRAVCDLLAAGRRVALVTVLDDAGSTPRKAGTKAVVDAEGNLWGTIGGGLIESQARRAAVEAIATGRTAVFDFRFNGASAAGDDPVCGGTMRVLVDPTAAAHLPAYTAAAEAARRRRRGVLLTRVRGGAWVAVEWQ